MANEVEGVRQRAPRIRRVPRVTQKVVGLTLLGLGQGRGRASHQDFPTVTDLVTVLPPRRASSVVNLHFVFLIDYPVHLSCLRCCSAPTAR